MGNGKPPREIAAVFLGVVLGSGLRLQFLTDARIEIAAFPVISIRASAKN
jgi:hypothetical protein